MISLENYSDKNGTFLYAPIPFRINSSVSTVIETWQNPENNENNNWIEEQWVSEQLHLQVPSPNHIIRPPNPLHRSLRQYRLCTSNLSNGLTNRTRSRSMSEIPTTFHIGRCITHSRTLQYGTKVPNIYNTCITLRGYAS
ncbi:unnamed protein product [Pneumocystis jirovecii]|uniref:Uncharacterized protein n=2 Tax=Pneumocystis jirovecii TaxID=42068 RepID=L0PF94_PNEJI|nr:uncharacterized protein T551_02393 [Pneumocystis jirovecii RU7]KTW29119.1 hypothetical protein T551_02393 [Pneumocystis jirovecii RU7]CCJ30872.1 unnamed protein product [Pneumocystis jirovecii]